MKQVKIKLLLVLLSMVIILSACGLEKSTEEKLIIGFIPTLNKGTLDPVINKLGDYLEQQINVPVTINVYPDYNGVVEAMNNDQIDMAYFGPLTYVLANQQNGAKAIVTQLINGEPFYYSYIITHKNSQLASTGIEDLINNSSSYSFAFGDPNSTSGALIPGIMLQDKGVYQSAQQHSFKSLVFTGGHDATALAVEEQQIDAGAIDSAIYDLLVENGTIAGDKFKIIWQSEKLFQYPWAISDKISDELAKKIQDAFINITDQEILNAFNATGFTKASDTDYESIRQAAIKAGRLE